jgi:hypothetical protein
VLPEWIRALLPLFTFPLTYGWVRFRYPTKMTTLLSNSPLAALNNLLTFVIIPSLTIINMWKTADSDRDGREHLTALKLSTQERLYSLIL